MTAESLSQNNNLEASEKKKSFDIFPEYPPFLGRPGSSSNNWVAVDYIGYRISKLLKMTDEDIGEKNSKT